MTALSNAFEALETLFEAEFPDLLFEELFHRCVIDGTWNAILHQVLIVANS